MYQNYPLALIYFACSFVLHRLPLTSKLHKIYMTAEMVY